MVVFRKLDKNLVSILDRNAGRIRYDYVGRLEKSISKFDKELHAAVNTITESLKSALCTSPHKTENQAIALNLLDTVIVLLCYKNFRKQHGHLGRERARWVAIWRRTEAIEYGLCRSVRTGSAAGCVAGLHTG